MQRKLEEAQAFMDTVNRSKIGQAWKDQSKSNEPGQLAQRPVGEGISIGAFLSLNTSEEEFCSSSCQQTMLRCSVCMLHHGQRSP